MPNRPRVALDVETSRIYGRRILEGVTRFLQVEHPWSVQVRQWDLDSSRSTPLMRWDGEGIITRQATPALSKRVRKLGIAAVDVGDIRPHVDLPRVGSDQHAIAGMAAEHFLERGFRSFAFCGFSDQRWSIERREGFIAAVASRGISSCEVFESTWLSQHSWETNQKRTRAWIESLDRPVGIFASNDVRGQHVLDACCALDVAVPEEIAVVGVDDDALFCEICSPPLSSVIPNADGVGYEAAALLDRLMTGKEPPPERITLQPIGVATRQSTDVLAINDSVVASAVRFIREHACQGAGMKDLLRAVPASRSLLERRFRKYLGRSPQMEFRNVRLKRVKQLLSETDLTLNQIAPLAGFDHPEYMSVVFRRELGETPGQFRQRARPC